MGTGLTGVSSRMADQLRDGGGMAETATERRSVDRRTNETRVTKGDKKVDLRPAVKVIVQGNRLAAPSDRTRPRQNRNNNNNSNNNSTPTCGQLKRVPTHTSIRRDEGPFFSPRPMFLALTLSVSLSVSLSLYLSLSLSLSLSLFLSLTVTNRIPAVVQNNQTSVDAA